MSKIIVNTQMTKSDYRHFMYLATFKKNKFMLPLLLAMALLGSLFIVLEAFGFDLGKWFIGTAMFLCFEIAVLVLKIEFRIDRRYKTDCIGTFNRNTRLTFYLDKVVIEQPDLKSSGELTYEQFYSLRESASLFMFYLNANQATLVRKKDVEDVEGLRSFLMERFGTRYKKM